MIKLKLFFFQLAGDDAAYKVWNIGAGSECFFRKFEIFPDGKINGVIPEDTSAVDPVSGTFGDLFLSHSESLQ